MTVSERSAGSEKRRRTPHGGGTRVLARLILVSVGSEDGTTTIDVGTIFREALKVGAEKIIVEHNHPSGDLTPSSANVVATTRLREAADLLGVPLVDHLIIGKHDSVGGVDFASLVEE